MRTTAGLVNGTLAATLAVAGALAPAAWARAAFSASSPSAAAAFSSSGATGSPRIPGGPGTGGQHAGQPYLGIDVRDVPDTDQEKLHLHDLRGAEIIRVDHDGPAGKMGLREHDVIVQMNGVAIQGQDQIRRMLRGMAPGAAVVLVVERGGQPVKLSAEIADRGEVERQAWAQHLIAPSAQAQAPSSAMPTGDAAPLVDDPGGPAAPVSRYSKGFFGTLLMSPSYTGAMLELMGPQLAQFFGVPGGGGLLVRSVAESSPAARAGLKAGDIVLRANNHWMGTLNDWAKQIRKAKGHPVSVLVLRGKEQKTLVLTPDGKHRSSLEYPQQPAGMMEWARAKVSIF